TEHAFLLGSPPPRPDDKDPNLRTRLEIEHNTPPNPAVGGEWTNFATFDYVRLMTQAGKDYRFEYLGVRSWSYETTGYKFELDYEVETPMAKFPLTVVVLSSEGRSRAAPGKQWQVFLRETRRTNFQENIEFTEEGKLRQALAADGEGFAEVWGNAIA